MPDYVRVVDGRILDGPKPCPKVWGQISGFDRCPPDEQRRMGWYPFEPGAEPAHDPQTQKLVWHLDVGASVRSYATVEPLTDTEISIHLEAERASLLARNAELRWQRETGGMEIDGIPLHTGRDSQVTLFAAAIRGLDEVWKGADGEWYSVSAEQLAQMSEIVAGFKSACFQKEAQIAQRIGACATFADMDAIDLEALWDAMEPPEEVDPGIDLRADDVRLINAEEARRLAGGISRSTVLRWRKAGLLPDPVTIRGRNYWPHAEFLDALAELS